MTERSSHRVSFGADVHDAEAAVSPTAGGVTSPKASAAARHAYDPKRKVRLRFMRRAAGAIRNIGVAKLVSGGISVFLLLSVFSVR